MHWHHLIHASHTTSHRRHRSGSLIRLSLDDYALCGDHERGYASGIDQCGSHNLERINNSSLHEVGVFSGGRIVSKTVGFKQLADNNRTLDSSVLCNGLARHQKSVLDDLHTDLLVQVGGDGCVNILGSVEESSTPSWNDTFIDRSTSCIQGICHAILLLPHLDLTCTPDLQDCDTPGELGKAFVKLLSIVVRGGGVHRITDLFTASLKSGGLTSSVQ
mmetsp:Transcript_7079/g.8152  ORF Transcript_7079/g.8152 Transcript_7079/m.8152 type:complete len:218 (+) Transcript_7079:647-1300(+)